jgi:hypothetical protein
MTPNPSDGENEMATYSVKLPISGYVLADVEAASEKEAIQKAMDHDFRLADIEEWQVMEYLSQGNISYASCNEASAEKVED